MCNVALCQQTTLMGKIIDAAGLTCLARSQVTKMKLKVTYHASKRGALNRLVISSVLV